MTCPPALNLQRDLPEGAEGISVLHPGRRKKSRKESGAQKDLPHSVSVTVEVVVVLGLVTFQEVGVLVLGLVTFQEAEVLV